MTSKRLLIIPLVFIVLAGAALATKVLFLDAQTDSISALQIDSFPKASVSLNDKTVGETPFSSQDLKPGLYKLRLFPTNTTGTYYPWETEIKLTSDSLTYINRVMGKNDAQSSDQILWLEKLPNPKSAELAIVSDPDSATVTVDGINKGIAPIVVSDVNAGDHDIIISATGYSDQIIKGKLIPGQRLNAAVKLAQKSDLQNLGQNSAPISTSSATLSTASATISSTSGNLPKPYVLIKDTGVGFLRVREEPNLNATEEAKVKPGEQYPLLLEMAGWVKIKIASISGYVSDQYIEKFK